eukprot:TRINITY_DN7538_c0_g1_i1.p1 TRINITY_DN7538_c0_g1~~TRINITY_DN7538_c0_g1_i1.p1  ORF type:complete len:150 (+),score=23.03 TRINITY_DN7538_c0_g1_i1:469-918(+)
MINPVNCVSGDGAGALHGKEKQYGTGGDQYRQLRQGLNFDFYCDICKRKLVVKFGLYPTGIAFFDNKITDNCKCPQCHTRFKLSKDLKTMDFSNCHFKLVEVDLETGIEKIIIEKDVEQYYEFDVSINTVKDVSTALYIYTWPLPDIRQ